MTINIQTLNDRIRKAVWETPVDTLPPWKAKLLGAVRITYLIIRDLLEGHLTLRAMGLVYTTLLSLVPLIAVSFSMLKGFGVHNQVEPLLFNLLTPLGEKGVEIATRIIEFVDNVKVGVLGSLGLVVFIYTVISLVQKIERAFNFTWRVTEARPFAQRFSNYLSVILVGPVLVFTAIGITASITSTTVVQKLMAIAVFGDLIKVGTQLLPYVLIIVAFAFIYVFVPNTKVRVRSALVGALIAGVLWESTGFAFASFVASSTKYTAIYSALASLIFFMIWLQISWLILLIGASIAFYHQHPEYRTLQQRMPQLSSRLKEKLALQITALIARNYYRHQAPWTQETLAQHLRLAADALTPLVDCLVEAQLLVHTTDVPPALLPAQAPETLQLTDIIDAVRRSGDSSYLNIERLPPDAGTEAMFNCIEHSMRNCLHGQTLKQLVPDEPGGK